MFFASVGVISRNYNLNLNIFKMATGRSDVIAAIAGFYKKKKKILSV